MGWAWPATIFSGILGYGLSESGMMGYPCEIWDIGLAIFCQKLCIKLGYWDISSDIGISGYQDIGISVF